MEENNWYCIFHLDVNHNNLRYVTAYSKSRRKYEQYTVYNLPRWTDQFTGLGTLSSP